MSSPVHKNPAALKRQARHQLVKVLRDHDEDVNGAKMTVAMIAERKAALHRCGDFRRKLEAAPKGRDQARTIVRATELFLSLGTGYEDVGSKKEAFLVIARSGLLPLCVDITLKAHEDIGRPPDQAMVICGERLLTLTNLEGAREVTEENWVRCTQFVGHHMRAHTLPKGITRNWKSILQRWALFLEHKPYREDYCRRCLVDTTVSTFIRKAAEGTPGWAYHARQDLIKALQEYKEEEEEDEEDEDDEDGDDDDDDSGVSSDDPERISSP
jgi:hypothetical protein